MRFYFLNLFSKANTKKFALLLLVAGIIYLLAGWGAKPQFKDPDDRLRVVSILGTRPEVIKFAILLKELKIQSKNIESIVISTGQQKEMLQQQLKIFDLTPDIELDIMKKNQTLESVLAAAVTSLTSLLRSLRPNIVLVQGDTTTALAGALAAFYNKIPVGHIEAGLRTYNIYNPYPEEANRKLLADLSLFHFAPTKLSRDRLVGEGVPEAYVYQTGNPVIDAFKYIQQTEPSAEAQELIDKFKKPKKRMILLTMHRRESFGEQMQNVCEAIKETVEELEDVFVVFPVHLNPNVKKVVKSTLGEISRVHLIEPAGYEPFVRLLEMSYLIVTDSGGIQEEATAAGKPVILIRKNTERPEGVLSGVIKQTGTDKADILEELRKFLNDPDYYASFKKQTFPYGEGDSAKKILQILLDNSGDLKEGAWKDKLEELSEKISERTIIESENNEVNVQRDVREVNELLTTAAQTTRNNSMCDALYPVNDIVVNPVSHLPIISWAEVMAKDTKFKANKKSPAFAWTAIVSGWKRPQVITRILESLAAQSVPPTEIWISIFHSSFEEEYVKAVRSYIGNIPVQLIVGDPQLSYWARFQLALQVKTPYTFVMDDDAIPGPLFVETALQTINTEYRGLLGVKGYRTIPPTKSTDKVTTLENTEMYFSPGDIQPADLVGGGWFFESSWVKYLFYEEPTTWLTGEDFHFTHMLRKYLNIPTYVTPVNRWNRDTWGLSKDFISISQSGDTTLYVADSRRESRSVISERIWKTGSMLAASRETYENHPFLLFVIESRTEALLLRDSFQHLHAELSESRGVTLSVAVAGRQQSKEQHIAEILFQSKVQEKFPRFLYPKIEKMKDSTWMFDLRLSPDIRDDPYQYKNYLLEKDAINNAGMICDAILPRVIIGSISKNSPSLALLKAFVTVADEHRIPFIALVESKDDLLNLPGKKRKNLKMLEAAADWICEVSDVECVFNAVSILLDKKC